MTTSFPLNPEVNDLYQGYYWDGNFWKRSGQDTGFGYLEEATLQNTYLSQSSASTNYLTQASASTQYEKLIPYSSSAPNSPSQGDLWVDSTVPTIKAYIGSAWVSVGGGASDSDQGIISSRLFT